MRVIRTDQWLRELDHPDVQLADPQRLGIGDVLVTCAGFEDRALEGLRRIVKTGSKGFRVVCIRYLPVVAANKVADVEQLCAEADAGLEWLTFDRQSPAGAAEHVLTRVAEADQLNVDISGMSRLLIVQLVAAIFRNNFAHSAEVLYCSAEIYPPTTAEVEAKLADPADVFGVAMFVSTGVFGLTIVPELSSVAMQGQPIRVVVFPSWNTMQLAAVCSEMQASYFTVVHGTPPDPHNAWRPQAIRALNRVDALPARDELWASTLDYRDTLKLVLDTYAAHGQREKLVVCPTGSKMQSLAVGVACGFLRDVQVAYPTPRSFADPIDYTRGVGRFYRLPLASFAAPRRVEAGKDLLALTK